MIRAGAAKYALAPAAFCNGHREAMNSVGTYVGCK